MDIKCFSGQNESGGSIAIVLLSRARPGSGCLRDDGGGEQRGLFGHIYRGLHDQLAKGIPRKSSGQKFAGKMAEPVKGKADRMHITHPRNRGDGYQRHCGPGILLFAYASRWPASWTRMEGSQSCCFGRWSAPILAPSIEDSTMAQGLSCLSFPRARIIFIPSNTPMAFATQVRRR